MTMPGSQKPQQVSAAKNVIMTSLPNSWEPAWSCSLLCLSKGLLQTPLPSLLCPTLALVHRHPENKADTTHPRVWPVF